MKEQGVTPLSTEVNENLIEALRKKIGNTTSITENKQKQLVAFAPVPITLWSTQFGFGGSKESIDHIKGNKGEGWHAVIFLNKEKTLTGLIPICMHCKEIRDDRGFWNNLEKYICEHSEAKFSHGCCPSCLAKYYPDIAKLNKE